MKKELKISLEGYLKEDPEVTEFLNNDDFWNNIRNSSEIPVDYLVERDPTAIIVGKEKEIEVGKRVNYLGAQIELQREIRFANMFIRLLEIDYLKKNGFRARIEKVELKMENYPDYDWERDYEEKVIEPLEEEGKYNRKKILKSIFKNLEKIVLEAEVDYKRISDKLKLELPTPPIYYLEGPMGSGKSFIQRRLMLSYMKLAKEVGIRGFDVLAIRDPLDPDKPKVIKLLGGEGAKLTTYYDNIMRKRNIKEKWKKKGMIGGILAFPVYYACRMGIELVAYSWGGSIGHNPFLDIGMWVNRDKAWIIWLTSFSLGAKLVDAIVKRNAKSESKRPQWLSNSRDMPPVYVGKVGRENLEGEYKENTDLSPQNWLRGSSLMTSDGKIAIIEQLPELTPDEQSWLSQLIQEREISIGNKGEHTIELFPILYIGANPHLTNQIEQPLMDRLQLGASCYVINEIDRNPETKIKAGLSPRTERKFRLFLEDYRKGKGGRPFSEEAMSASLEVASKLAEDKDQIEISRRLLLIFDSAMEKAKGSKNPYVTKENIIEALPNAKSIVEQKILEVKIKNHYDNSMLNFEDREIGAAKILGYLTDKYIIDHENKDIKKELEEENGLGYVSEVRAIVKETTQKDEAGLKIMTPKNWSDKNGGFKERLSLILEDEIKLSDYKIVVDLSKVLEEDDALLPSTYIAIKSAIEKKPVKQDVAIASNCDLEGKLTPISKVNKRIYTSPDNINSVIISTYDFNQKLNQALPIGPKVNKVDNLKNLYTVLTK